MYDNQQQGGFGGGRGNQPSGGPKQMFSATCADCGKQCEVPFRPSGDKPVYCKDCFNKRRDGSPRDAGRGTAPSGNYPKPNFAPAKQQQQQSSAPRLEDLKRQMDAMNAKLDTLLQKFEGAGPKTSKSSAKKVAAKKPRKAAKSSKK